MARAAGMAYREAGDPGAPPVLLVHGYPETSYMWRHAMAALAEAGWRAIAPDLPGYGDSPPGDRPGTWEAHVDSLGRFVDELGLDQVVLVVHDWGVLIGLRWACDHPGSVRGLVISDGGFFADRRWHDMANAMRTPDEGEKLIDGFTREGFESLMGSVSSGIGPDAVEEYWKAFATTDLRRRHLEMYRSGDFEKLEPYEGRLAELGVPALIVWGEQDRFAGVKMARRFHDELPGSELVVLDEAGHFVWEDEPEATSRAVVEFLERRVRSELRLRHDVVLWREVDGEVVALDVPAAEYLGANPTGALLWRMLAEGSDRDRLTAALVEGFDVDGGTAAADVERFVAHLRERGLLEE